MSSNRIKTLEHGDLYFFFRPRVEEESPEKTFSEVFMAEPSIRRTPETVKLLCSIVGYQTTY